jgi:hypothetical protein
MEHFDPESLMLLGKSGKLLSSHLPAHPFLVLGITGLVIIFLYLTTPEVMQLLVH